MSDNVRRLSRVPAVDPAASIADALEEMARDIRAGATPFAATRCVVILAGGEPGGEFADLAVACLGSDKSLLTDLGMLEMAKIELIEGARP